MSKAKGKKGGKEEAETNIKVRKDIKEAKMLTLSVVEEELKFGKVSLPQTERKLIYTS